jgi:hypothetical protein
MSGTPCDRQTILYPHVHHEPFVTYDVGSSRNRMDGCDASSTAIVSRLRACLGRPEHIYVHK